MEDSFIENMTAVNCEVLNQFDRCLFVPASRFLCIVLFCLVTCDKDSDCERRTFVCMYVFVLTEASQERIRAVKESLQSCKNLLHCKRDELRRLWIEGVEMKTVYASLDAVEQVKDVAEQIPGLITSRKYLMATELVISSLAVLDTELSDVDALQQVSLLIDSRSLSVSYIHTYIYLFNGSLSWTTHWCRYHKGKTNLDLLEQEIVSSIGISWAICKSAPHPKQITMPAPHHSVFLQAG